MKTHTYERITKLFLAGLPSEVAATLKATCKEERTSKIGLTVTDKYALYPAEGYDFHVFYKGERKSLSMFRQDSIGASGVCYDLSGSVEVPGGTWIISISDWIMGKRVVSLTYVTLKMIEA